MLVVGDWSCCPLSWMWRDVEATLTDFVVVLREMRRGRGGGGGCGGGGGGAG